VVIPKYLIALAKTLVRAICNRTQYLLQLNLENLFLSLHPREREREKERKERERTVPFQEKLNLKGVTLVLKKLI
jgi:hypothetical protein